MLCILLEYNNIKVACTNLNFTNVKGEAVVISYRISRWFTYKSHFTYCSSRQFLTGDKEITTKRNCHYYLQRITYSLRGRPLSGSQLFMAGKLFMKKLSVRQWQGSKTNIIALVNAGHPGNLVLT